MPEDIEQDGGTQETQGTQEQLEAAIQAAREEGKKEGQSEAHKHWQSVADKQIAAVREAAQGKLSEYEKHITELRQAQMETMTPEERNQALLKEVLDRLDRKESGPEQTETFSGSQTADFDSQEKTDPRTEAQNQIAPVLKEMGVDLTKVDWGTDAPGVEGMRRFLKSLADQWKTPPHEHSESEEEQEANRVDSSRRTGSNQFDILKADPLDLISAGLKESNPSRRLG